MNRGLVLTSSLKVVRDELRKGERQRVEEIWGKKLCQEKERKQQLEDVLSPIY